MNQYFLEYVAQDMTAKLGPDFSRVAVVFPNKRASLFMDDYLARLADKPLWSPAYTTISELFRKHSSLMLGDSLQLVCSLYKVFITYSSRKSETLDQFFGWGQLLLADFDDVDKHLADPQKVFANLRDIHELDDTSYLTDRQRDTLRPFFGDIIDRQDSELKRKFMELWSNLYAIYRDYNELLASQGVAYEGAIYRQVAENPSLDFEYDMYVFVGFNMLQEAEMQLFQRLKDAGKAMFYWDFDHYYLDNASQEAGHFIRQYLERFPCELDTSCEAVYNRLSERKDITYMAAKTEDIQARYMAQWLREGDRIRDDRRTAIVLCDESLLPTTLHGLPPEVTDVNITTGYPLSLSPVAAWTDLLIALQTTGYAPDRGLFRARLLRALVRHPVMRHVSADHEELSHMLEEEKRYYYSPAELGLDEGLRLLFTPVSPKGKPTPRALCQWMLSLLRLVGRQAKDDSEPLFQESLFRMYTLLNRLSSLIEGGGLDIDLSTFQRLTRQLVKATSIPFHGEPAEGIQIMGLLETRNLDFDHVLLLSCNEGNLPKAGGDTSFIPYSIRKAYGLTTSEHQVAIYAYYFYRLLSRAKDVTICYNTATEDGKTGEMSRFMLQLMVERDGRPDTIHMMSLQAGQTLTRRQAKPIAKSEAVMHALMERESLTPTSLNRYLRCQLTFYYNDLLGIREPDSSETGDVDNRMFGNIFHRAAQLMYGQRASEGTGPVRITPDMIARMRKDSSLIARMVDAAFNEEFFKERHDITRRDYNGLQYINRQVIIRYIRDLLEIDSRLAPFSILGLEQWVERNVTFPLGTGEHTIKTGGYIDRLDQVTLPDGTTAIRVVDYKTGRQKKDHPLDMAELFTGESIVTKHTDYYLQTILYALAVRDGLTSPIPIRPALLFIQQTHRDDYDPTLLLGRDTPITDVARYADDFDDQLRHLLSDIFNPELPFMPTDDLRRCEHCPYRQLCSR